MPRLTNGTFKYTRRVKPGDPNEYNAPFREATAEISWMVPEDEDQINPNPYLDKVREATVEQVNKMLGKAPTPAVEVPQGMSVTEAAARYQSNAAPSVDPAATDMMALEVRKRAPGRSRKETSEAAIEPSVSSQTKPEEPEAEDDLLGDIASPSVVEISTKDLLDAITRKNAERMARPEGSIIDDGRDGRSVQLIRDLVRKYVQLPQTARDIPRELRRGFLEELKCL